MIEHKMSRARNGVRRLTVVVEGEHDIYRFADHLTRGQCEFAAIGFKAIKSVKRSMGKTHFAALENYMYGKSVHG